jgi:hypothetical protein
VVDQTQRGDDFPHSQTTSSGVADDDALAMMTRDVAPAGITGAVSSFCLPRPFPREIGASTLVPWWLEGSSGSKP